LRRSEWMVGDDAAMANSSAEGRRPYATDLTDAQWSLVEPILPAPNLDGQHEKHPRREIVNAIFYLLRTGSAVHGGCCPTICRRGRRCTATSGAGRPTARSTASTTGYVTGCVTMPGAIRWPRLGSSTPSRQGSRHRRCPIAWLRRRQAHQRPQTPHGGRHPRAVAAGVGHHGGGAGPHRRPPGP
jgi:hypothetical protein